jgi:hypothetical protein
VIAGFGQQADIIADALVTVGATDVEHLGSLEPGKRVVRQIGAGRHRFDTGKSQRALFGIFNHHQNSHTYLL